MAHLEQALYCIKIKSLFGQYFFNADVLDIGSLDINGNNRYLFQFSKYFGIDIGQGKNVDMVCPGHHFGERGRFYNTIISTEVFEHDKFWDKTITNAIRLLKPGGLLIFTCATTGRLEHGTKRTGTDYSPYTPDYYQNVTEEMVRSIPGFAASWRYSKFSTNDKSHDLQFVGIKKGGEFKFRPSLLLFIVTWCRWFYRWRIRNMKSYFQKSAKTKTPDAAE